MASPSGDPKTTGPNGSTVMMPTLDETEALGEELIRFMTGLPGSDCQGVGLGFVSAGCMAWTFASCCWTMFDDVF